MLIFVGWNVNWLVNISEYFTSNFFALIWFYYDSSKNSYQEINIFYNLDVIFKQWFAIVKIT